MTTRDDLLRPSYTRIREDPEVARALDIARRSRGPWRQEIERIRAEYNTLIIDSFNKPKSAGYMKKLEAKNIELQVAEAKGRTGTGDLSTSELDTLIGEVEAEYEAPEDRAVFQEAETMARTQIERDTARALESLRPPKKFRTPAQKPRPYREPADVIADRVQRKVNTGELKASLSSTALDPETGVLTGTTWEGTLTSHPMQGVAIRQEYQPPQADLFMEPGPEVELQRLRSSSGGPWERDEDVYTWMRPTDAEIQEELVLYDEAYGRQGTTRYRSYSETLSEMDEKLESIEREEESLGFLQTDRGVLRGRMQPETELTRARVQLTSPGSGSYEQLDDGTVYLERYDRMMGQRERLRKLEARREAVRERRSQLQEQYEGQGPELGDGFGVDQRPGARGAPRAGVGDYGG